MENIKKTFEEIAREYDEIIQRFMPYYPQMLEAVICALPFERAKAIFERYEFDDIYDVAISSLALHHLLTDEDKKAFYQKIYENLAPGGVFYNADLILGSSDRIQEVYMEQWKAFMRKQLSEDEIENQCISKYYEEDRPAKLLEQLSWLTDLGFHEVDVLWKYYNFAVYGGCKQNIS
jgi:tRNA (cmo5U34)-methyltransferase